MANLRNAEIDWGMESHSYYESLLIIILKNSGKWLNAPEGCNDSLDLEMPKYRRICT